MATPSGSSAQVSLALLLPLLAAMVAITPLAIDLYLPAMAVIAEHFSADIVIVQNSLSIYLLGYALGLVVFGPLADKFSRRKLVMIGLVGFMVTSLLLPFVVTIEQFLVVRFLQAFISTAASIVVPSTIREIYGKNTAKGLSYVSMIMMLAPMIAPTIGSALLWLHSWQFIFYGVAIYAFVVLVLAIKYLPEANHQKEGVQQSFIKRYKIVLSAKTARFDLLTTMTASLAFFAYITAIPFVYLTVFEVSSFHFSLLFAANVGALMIAQFINTRFVVRLGSRTMLRLGLTVALMSVLALVLVNWLQLSLIYTVICIFPLMGGLSLTSVNADALVLTQFTHQTGTATAVIGVLKFGVGALAGPILAFFYNGTALPFALLMAASVMAVVVLQFIYRVKFNASKVELN